jgi:hypothetical protein
MAVLDKGFESRSERSDDVGRLRVVFDRKTAWDEWCCK